ncbi:Obg family GTPase CgtA, partial [Nocardioides sp. GCM10030258]
LRARGHRVFEISAMSGEGTRELIFAMAEIVQEARKAKQAEIPARIVVRPKAVDDDGFTITSTKAGWRVVGKKPERWVRQTNFSNDEAVGYLADRLNRLGVETRLLQMGAEAGDSVLIGPTDDSVVFEFRPGVDAGAENLSRRGEDDRFQDDRQAAIRRREIQAKLGERAEGETRADVARRIDKPEVYGPTSYEIGSEEDPDVAPAVPEDEAWLEEDPGE